MAMALAPFEQLAATDPAVAPLARLQAVALRAAEEPAWAAGLPELGLSRAEPAAPLLQGATLAVDPDRLRALLRALVATLGETGALEAERIEALLAAAELEPLEVLRAGLVQDHAHFEAVAARTAVEPAVLAVLAHTATLPLLLACGRRVAGRPEPEPWPHGYCPLCAAWPTLAEQRGLERTLFLRCGRCASGWQIEHRRCPFCGSRAQRSQRYFAAEQEREMRRAVTCDPCQGYFKVQATLGPLDLPELLLRDLETIELDLAALEHGYCRPDAPGWALSLQVEPIRWSAPPAGSRQAPSAGSGQAPSKESRRASWLRWR